MVFTLKLPLVNGQRFCAPKWNAHTSFLQEVPHSGAQIIIIILCRVATNLLSGKVQVSLGLLHLTQFMNRSLKKKKKKTPPHPKWPAFIECGSLLAGCCEPLPVLPSITVWVCQPTIPFWMGLVCLTDEDCLMRLLQKAVAFTCSPSPD